MPLEDFIIMVFCWVEEHLNSLLGKHQELIGMPRRAVHRRQYPVDEHIGHVLVKQVRHRADEIEGGLLPSEG